MEGHHVQGNPKLSAVHPVHEGEDEDPTREEAHKDHDAVEFVQPGVVKTQLDVRWVSSGWKKIKVETGSVSDKMLKRCRPLNSNVYTHKGNKSQNLKNSPSVPLYIHP